MPSTAVPTAGLDRRTFLTAGAATTGLLVTAGLPTARATAAPFTRRPTHESAYPFTLGIASGDPRHDSVVLWTRLAPEPLTPTGGMGPASVTVAWEIATDERMHHVVRRGMTTATAALGHAVHVEARGLHPGRDHWYRFRAGTHLSEVGHTRTLAHPRSSPLRLRVAVACCQHFQTGYYTAWRSLIDSDPDLVLFLGDYIYEYPPDDPGGFYLPERLHFGPPEPEDLGGYRVRWSQYKLDANLQRAHAAVPFVTIWDDHEVKNDYAGLTPQPADVPHFAARRAAAYRAFYENLPMRRSPAADGFDHLRIHQRLQVGDLATFHVLDTRQYRDDQPCDDPQARGNIQVDDSCTQRHDPDRTMLGVEQRSWLLDGLATSSTRWDLITQQAMFATLDRDTGVGGLWEIDSWDGYTADRARILQALRDIGNTSTVVLSGDIHSHLVADLGPNPVDGSGPVLATELAAAGISSPPLNDFEAWVSTNPHIRYASDRNGYLLIDVRRDELRAEIRSMRNLIDNLWVGPHSQPFTDAVYAVEHGHPGAEPA